MKKLLVFILSWWGLSAFSQVFTYNSTFKNMNGQPGDGFYFTITFQNPTASSLTVVFDRFEKNNPPFWYSCFCYVTCNPPSLDVLNIDLAANSSSVLSVFFKTDSVNPGTATAKIKIFQAGFEANADTIQISATTNGLSTALNEFSAGAASRFFPNPVTGELLVESAAGEGLVLICDVNGSPVLNQPLSPTPKSHMDLSTLPAGIYFAEIRYASGKTEKHKLIKN